MAQLLAPVLSAWQFSMWSSTSHTVSLSESIIRIQQRQHRSAHTHTLVWTLSIYFGHSSSPSLSSLQHHFPSLSPIMTSAPCSCSCIPSLTTPHFSLSVCLSLSPWFIYTHPQSVVQNKASWSYSLSFLGMKWWGDSVAAILLLKYYSTQCEQS